MIGYKQAQKMRVPFRLFVPLCLCMSLPLIVSVYSVYSVVSYPLKFSTADGFKKWEFLEAENRTVFYGLGAEVEISIDYWVFLLACLMRKLLGLSYWVLAMGVMTL